MDMELFRRCDELDDASRGFQMRAHIKQKILWNASYALRKADVPHMTDSEVEFLTELAYLALFRVYRDILVSTYYNDLEDIPSDYKRYFQNIVTIARRLDKHGQCDIGTDRDWEAWIDSM
tara:strand:+ start:13490 stop:13849 length:360 start_codon:yes stop_codon:yes gene_type:complete